MGKTSYEIRDGEFYINGKLTYQEIPGSDPAVHGLLFNARFIQGIFDDKNENNKGKYDRFGTCFDAERNTDDLIRALPSWYEAGLRAITVGLQGGGPIYTYKDWSVIDTGSFSEDGRELRSDYKDRLLKVIRACDELGMLVIVSVLYQAQEHLFRDGVAMLEAVRTVSVFLRECGYENIILEVANEHDVGNFAKHPLFCSGEGIASVINQAREWSGGKFAVGSSGGGGVCKKEVIENSDVILVHGNTLRRQELYQFIRQIREVDAQKPIVCNEDSQMFGQLKVAYASHISWGYYNNFTKQEPPADWGITAGEDAFFARRLKSMILGKQEEENEFYLQGLEKDSDIDGGYYVRLASLYPEKIDYVEFYEDEVHLYTAFAEPFMMDSLTTWEQKPYRPSEQAERFRVKIFLHSGEVVERTANLRELREQRA